jgi:pseudo-response regulator 7
MPSIYFKMQSSWTKRDVEIDSPHPMSPNHLADSPDSTCAQVIHPKSEIGSNRWFPTTNKRSSNNQKQNNGTYAPQYLLHKQNTSFYCTMSTNCHFLL